MKAASSVGNSVERVLPSQLATWSARVLEAAGLDAESALLVGASLAESDALGVSSHGVQLLPMYVSRLRAGSVSVRTSAEILRDRGSVAVLDAHNMLGQLSALQAMRLAIAKAHVFGVGVVTVRNAFHVGAVGSYARLAAEAGLIGIATANTRPLLPAPGGAEPVVGNNPIAIAAPTAGEPVVLDMALSEVALGRIRRADAEGEPIPSTWATTVDGHPTTDAAQAIRGMLLPVGGHKGFGLALMVDMITGVLSGGGFGAEVAGLYADDEVPNNSAHTLIAMDPSFFTSDEEYQVSATTLVGQVRAGRRVPGSGAARIPGESHSERLAAAEVAGIAIPQNVAAQLGELGRVAGIDRPAWLDERNTP